MAAKKVEPLLNRVGKRVFVEYYEKLCDLTLRAGEVVALLPNEFTLKSKWSRTSKARRIFREGLEAQALTVIAASKRVNRAIADRAKQLLAELSAGKG